MSVPTKQKEFFEIFIYFATTKIKANCYLAKSMPTVFWNTGIPLFKTDATQQILIQVIWQVSHEQKIIQVAIVA